MKKVFWIIAIIILSVGTIWAYCTVNRIESFSYSEPEVADIVCNGTLQDVQKLIEAGLFCNSHRQAGGLSAQYLAFRHNADPMVANKLYKAKVCDSTSGLHFQAIHEAIIKKDAQKVRAKLGSVRGGDIDIGGYRLIHVAAKYGDKDTFKAAFEDIRAVNWKLEEIPAAESEDVLGRRPVHYAAENSDAEPMRILIEAGADLTAIDQDGLRAIDIANRLDNDKVIALLVAAGVEQ